MSFEGVKVFESGEPGFSGPVGDIGKRVEVEVFFASCGGKGAAGAGAELPKEKMLGEAETVGWGEMAFSTIFFTSSDVCFFGVGIIDDFEALG